VPDLAQRLAASGPASDCAGRSPEGRGIRSWNVSLGEPLDATPIVGTAVDVLALAWSTLPAGRAAALLRSAFLPGAGGGARESRARIERVWLERGLHRVRLIDAISALQRSEDALAERLASVHTVASRTRRANRHGWVDAWREGLRASGWPGERPLASPEHQAAGAFDGLLVAFAALDATAAARAEIAGDEALALLAELAAATPYQPEAPPAPIQILGLIEAIGLPFDALWVAGMSDAAWPRSPRPHPLLPVRWQRERGVPRSDAAGELAWARRSWRGSGARPRGDHEPRGERRRRAGAPRRCSRTRRRSWSTCPPRRRARISTLAPRAFDSSIRSRLLPRRASATGRARA
jgi:hypothetical protein